MPDVGHVAGKPRRETLQGSENGASALVTGAGNVNGVAEAAKSDPKTYGVVPWFRVFTKTGGQSKEEPAFADPRGIDNTPIEPELRKTTQK